MSFPGHDSDLDDYENEQAMYANASTEPFLFIEELDTESLIQRDEAIALLALGTLTASEVQGLLRLHRISPGEVAEFRISVENVEYDIFDDMRLEQENYLEERKDLGFENY
jgi:hypothetical protein